MSTTNKRILSVGRRGQDVWEVQNELRARGFYKGEVTGHFEGLTEAAVKAFQSANKLTPDGVVGNNTYNALGLMNMLVQPEFLMIHTTASSPNWTAETVRNYHLNTLKWGRPGYSKVIERDGKVVDLWRIDLTDGFQPHEVTFGAAEFNPISVHISYIGGIDNKGNALDNRTDEQKEAMKNIVFEMIDKVPAIQIGGHNQFHNKNCPCFSTPKWLREICVKEENIHTNDPFGYVRFYETGKWR
jgi:N-acetylmuramoyl-L-alanine amidase